MARICRLDALAGVTSPCIEDVCPFWEPGGAVLEGRCAFEGVDLTRRPAVLTELLRVREELMTAGNGESPLHHYHRILNESGEE